MRYLITGGNSFIGSALAKLLISQGHQVFVICRCDANVSTLPLSNRLSIIRYKGLEDILLVKDRIICSDVFVHLAWEGTGHEGRNDKIIQRRNIQNSLKAIDLARQLGCRLFLEAGSQAEYGIVKGVITDTTPCQPVTEYGRAKLEFGEKAALKCRDFDIKFIHLRILSIFGETDHLWTLVMSSIRKLLKGEDIYLSSCRQLWNFVSIADAVKQIYLLCQHALNTERFRSEIYLIGSHDTRILRSFIDEMYKLTDSSSILNFGSYIPDTLISLNPDMSKTEQATGGFISDYTFGQVITNIINNYKQGLYDKSI